jgi:hypothetical protein
MTHFLNDIGLHFISLTLHGSLDSTTSGDTLTGVQGLTYLVHLETLFNKLINQKDTCSPTNSLHTMKLGQINSLLLHFFNRRKKNLLEILENFFVEFLPIFSFDLVEEIIILENTLLVDFSKSISGKYFSLLSYSLEHSIHGSRTLS